MLTTAYRKNKAIKSQANQKGNGKIPPQADIKKVAKCFVCKKFEVDEEGDTEDNVMVLSEG